MAMPASCARWSHAPAEPSHRAERAPDQGRLAEVLAPSTQAAKELVHRAVALGAAPRRPSGPPPTADRAH
jgi:hypothetical protein